MAIKDVGKKVTEFYKKRYLELSGYKTPDMSVSIKKMLNTLKEIPDLVYGRYAFLREPIAGRLSDELKDELIKKATAEGEKYADEIRETYGNISLEDLAKKFGLDVSYPKKPLKESNVRFAEFEEPNKIRIFTDTFDKVDELIKEKKLESYFMDISIKDVLLGHELYHYMEIIKKDEILSRNYIVELWHIGPYKYTSHVAILAEIAAMSFSKKLNNISFNPYLFDVFLTYSYNREYAIYTYERILKLYNEYGE